MKHKTMFNAALGLCLALSGCGGAQNDAATPSNAGSGAASATSPAASSDAGSGAAPVDSTAPKKDSSDSSGANVDVADPESPEGVVDAFFRSFFKGDDDGAYALLTSKAREATRDRFSAQASDTVRWKVVRRDEPEPNRAFVYVDVEDYTDEGDVQTEELTFALGKDDGVWRVAGFSVGDVAIDFEERRIDAIAQDSNGAVPQEAATNVKVGRNVDAVVR